MYFYLSKMKTPQPNKEQGTRYRHKSNFFLFLCLSPSPHYCFKINFMLFFGKCLYSQLYVMYFQFSQMITPQPNKEQGTRYNHKSNFFLFLYHPRSPHYRFKMDFVLFLWLPRESCPINCAKVYFLSNYYIHKYLMPLYKSLSLFNKREIHN